MNSKFKLLIEEVSLRSDVVHHTDLMGLMGILKDGNLTAFKYSTSSDPNHQEFSPSREREIAVLRRSVDRNIKREAEKNPDKGRERLDSLTAGAGEVKIYLFNKNITSKLRGATQRPIAEYAKSHFEDFERFFENFYVAFSKMNPEISYFKLRREMKALGKRVGLHQAKTNKWLTAESKYFLNELKKLMMKLDLKIQNVNFKPKEFFNRVFGLVRPLIIAHSSGDGHREGEERIVFKNHKVGGVPVSSEFMKIRLLKNFTKSYLMFIQTEDVRTARSAEKFKEKGDDALKEERLRRLREFRDNLEKYKEVFLINREYRSLTNTIDEILKGDI